MILHLILVAIVIIVVIALLLPAVDYLVTNQPYNRLVKGLIILAGMLVLIEQAGLL